MPRYWDWDRDSDAMSEVVWGEDVERVLDKWFGSGKSRLLASDSLGGVMVATLFLCVEETFRCPPGVPAVFRSRVFGGPWDKETRHYPTPARARAGHEELCRLAFDDPCVCGRWIDDDWGLDRLMDVLPSHRQEPR